MKITTQYIYDYYKLRIASNGIIVAGVDRFGDEKHYVFPSIEEFTSWLTDTQLFNN